jgi:hypothetical protein
VSSTFRLLRRLLGSMSLAGSLASLRDRHCGPPMMGSGGCGGPISRGVLAARRAAGAGFETDSPHPSSLRGPRFHRSAELPGAALAALGLSERDVEQIRAVLAAYDRTNAMALITLSAVDCKIAVTGSEHDSVVAERTEAPASSQAKLILPSLLSLAEMSPETAELVVTINRLGAQGDAPILASMYRHLAHWPPYLALAWAMIAPLDADARLDDAILDVLAKARVSGRRVVARLPTPSLTLASAVRAEVSHALDCFTGDLIARMIVIGALLRRATGAKSNGA